jgi:hypothetical protein
MEAHAERMDLGPPTHDLLGVVSGGVVDNQDLGQL